MKRPLIFSEIGGRKSIADDHLSLSIQNIGYHFRGILWGIGIVSRQS